MGEIVTRTALVTGGTGNLGGQVVRRLAAAGRPVRVASRGTRPVGESADCEWAAVDYRTRAGLDDALCDVDVLVHCASGSAEGEAETMAALLSSGRRAGLPHLVYISIVGVDRLPMGYYQAKLAAERALIASGIPWTILRATQFHHLALSLVKGMCRLPIGLVPKGISCQPVAVDEVAARLVDLAAGSPAGRAPEFGGPEIFPFVELAHLYVAAAGRRGKVVPVPIPGRLARGLRSGYGLTPEHADGVQTFAEFLHLADGGRANP